jgi:hypothetical protein
MGHFRIHAGTRQERPSRRSFNVISSIPRLLPLAVLIVAAFAPAGVRAQPGDTQARLPPAAPGTRFAFEVIESHDAKYLGDTPGHTGRDGGLDVRPNVAIGDAVYRDDADGDPVVVGRITAVSWERVSGSLTVEFDPEPLLRIAVGDEVWIDLNPQPATPGRPVQPQPAAGESAR